MSSVIIEFHRWEGVSFSLRHDLFHSCLRVGFASVLVSRWRITEKLRRLVNRLEIMVAGASEGMGHGQE
ncbi:MAG TPA: hypothetical protein DCW68_02740 [Rhodospirillaceae bacterium]|nr:MAG: hypothetical protein A2018_05715 [Alphaproteobacteria bacterium GWF2_58_20]HAU29012.1 hypothetical protein [Rhodospirillaceae bacterium]